MAAYLIANITVTDPAMFARYREGVPAVIAQYGGRYLVRGGAVHPVEGDPGIDRCVILEFDTMQALRGFYDSPEYAPLLAMRLACTVSRAAIVEGITPG